MCASPVLESFNTAITGVREEGNASSKHLVLLDEAIPQLEL
jgi:hypothetical protein